MEIVFLSEDTQFQRKKGKTQNAPFQSISPTPLVIFKHPLHRRRVELEISDISTSGFSVDEKANEGVLMPGMIIPELSIEFVGAVTITGAAQVIDRKKTDAETVCCSLGILDMDINSYTRLSHILANAIDPHARISQRVDMDALWEFFFETGFIYPKKYGVLQHSKERFKKTYSKLYQENPEVSKHFTYQKSGRIYGHISMVRAYQRAWMIHHHAGRSMEGKRAGFLVLRQIMRYLNDVRDLPSARMDYVISFFRPENKFPDRVFGDFARALGNPQQCSMDLFSYLPYTGLSFRAKLPDGWTLDKSSEFELWELDRYYSNYSGGLLLDALGLARDFVQEEFLENVYDRLGLFRRQKTYSLKQGEELNAVLMIDRSDLGFNLSELLNGIKVVVINPATLSWNVLSIAIGQLVGDFHMERIPILFYPFEFVEAECVPYEKQYQAWVLNVRYGNEFTEYMHKKFRLRSN